MGIVERIKFATSLTFACHQKLLVFAEILLDFSNFTESSGKQVHIF